MSFTHVASNRWNPNTGPNLDFQKILEKTETRSRLWQKIRSLFDLAFIESWEALYAAILAPPQFVLKSA